MPSYPCHLLLRLVATPFSFLLIPFKVALAPSGTEACTVDIAKFHRTCPVIPDHKPWLVFQGHPGDFFIEHAHPFGASSASANAGMIVNALVDIWTKEGVGPIIKYEDDLAIFRSPLHPPSLDAPNPSYAYDKASALSLVASLRVPWHPEKGSPSFESLFTFIGLEWDLVAKTVALPIHKRLKYLGHVHSFLDRFTSSKCQLKDVEKLHGTLCYASFVYTDGRSHLPALSNFAATFQGNTFTRRFPSHTLLTDLRWWSLRLSESSFSRTVKAPGPVSSLDIFVDASTSWGIGIVIDDRWLAFKLKPNWKVPGRDIGWLETIAVELISHILDHWDFHDARIVIHSDNQGTIGAMVKGRSPNYHINMSIRRSYSILMPRFILPSLIYIESAKNPANSISRGILGPHESRLPICLKLPKVLLEVFEQQ